MNRRNIIMLLGTLGLAPYLVTTIGVMTKQLIFGFSASYLFVTYSALILSFLSGSLWGLLLAGRGVEHDRKLDEHLHLPGKRIGKRLLIVTNLLVGVIWIALLLTHSASDLTLTVLFLGYLLVLWIERSCYLPWLQRAHPQYALMRVCLTLIVGLSHLVVLFYTD